MSKKTDSMLQDFTRAFYDNNYKETVLLFSKLKKKRKEGLKFKETIDGITEYKHFRDECKVIEKVVMLLLEDLWVLLKAQDDTYIETKKIANDMVMKVGYIVECDPIHLISILFEVDLYSSWVHTVKTSETINQVSDYRRRMLMRYNLPWPLNNRQSIVEIACVPMPELSAVLLLLYTPEDVKDQPTDGRYIQMVVPFCGAWIKKKGDSSEVTIAAQANKYIVRAI
jgi:hypothetical protein